MSEELTSGSSTIKWATARGHWQLYYVFPQLDTDSGLFAKAPELKPRLLYFT